MWPFGLFKRSKESKYRARLSYAITRLEKPLYEDLADRDRQYKLEIVRWLLAYYMNDPDALGEGSPEIRLAKTLRKRVNDVTKRDHVYVSVLYSWTQHKRIEGY